MTVLNVPVGLEIPESFRETGSRDGFVQYGTVIFLLVTKARRVVALGSREAVVQDH